LAVDAHPAGQLTTAMQEAVDAKADERPAVDVEAPTRQRSSRMRSPFALVLVIVVVVGGLFGWLGYRGHEARQVQQHRDLFLQVGRQAALNLTTISSNEADGDVQRILDSSIGKFHDDFAQRAPAFIDLVKKAQSNTTGSVTAAGLESEASDRAQVLVAVAVKTSTAGAPGPQQRAWRMRVTVAKVDDGAKITDVVFVP
jgi:Mce-associated membrane protein